MKQIDKTCVIYNSNNKQKSSHASIQDNCKKARSLSLIFPILFSIISNAQGIFDLHAIKNTGLRYVLIDTENEEWPTCEFVDHPEGSVGQSIRNANKVKGRIRILQGETTLYDSGDYQEDTSGMLIKIRGNSSSAKQSKQTYKIKLQSKKDLLFRDNEEKFKDKNWLLIRDERISFNTMIGIKVNELLNLQWTPGYQYVNLIINNDYRGIYILIESVERNSNCRLNVDKHSGYIFEYDPYWWNEDLYFETPHTVSPTAKFTFKYPDNEDIEEKQIDYIKGVLEHIEQTLDNGEIPKEIDIESFASWVLCQDILGNWDGLGSNIYITKFDDTDSSKVMMGNLWDFDMIMKQDKRWSNSHWVFYFRDLLENSDPTFTEAYKKRWKEVREYIYPQITESIKSYAMSEEGLSYGRSIPFDNARWERDGKTIDDILDEAINWFYTRKIWLDSAIIGEANTISPILRNVANNDIIFNIQGIRQNSISSGINIIRRKDGTTRKTLAK